MKLVLESKNNINITDLPYEINGNYWITYNSYNLINVDAQENKWILKSNTDIKINKNSINDKMANFSYIDSLILEENKYYYIVNINTKEEFILYSLPTYENFENFIVDYNQNNSLTVGVSEKSDIILKSNILKDEILKIELNKNNNAVYFAKLSKTNRLFLNGGLSENNNLTSGDILFFGGIFIYYFGSLLLISNNQNNILFNSLKLNKMIPKHHENKDYSQLTDRYIKVFNKEDFFVRPPRFVREIENKTIEIDSPTNKQNDEEMPLIYTLGPMMLMGVTSFMSGITAIMNVISGKATFKENATSIITSISMLVSMLVFPFLQKMWQKVNLLKKERKRRRKYKKYIQTKRDEIFKEIEYQKQVLIEDNIEPVEIAKRILNKSRNIWERKNDHADFLSLRLGIGNKKPELDIKYPEEHFTMEEDDLKDIIYDLVNESKDITNVPIPFNFKTNNKTGLIGVKPLIYNFYDNLLLQLIGYHGYDMLRIIVLTNNTNDFYWEKYKNLPYLWTNDKSLRFYANNKEDINKLTTYLMEEFNYRKDVSKGNNLDYALPYYLVIVDDSSVIKSNNFLNEILISENNLGYSVLMCVDRIDELPNETKMFISVNNENGGIFSNKMTKESQVIFKPDYINFSLKRCISIISNIPMDVNSGKFVLPRKYGFLEMYDVGNVNQLNIVNRWKNNDVINSLSCPVGIDEQGELFNIDLHEKAHGPHGLVAGMTGSGKSEWIITYILSMALNYSPLEVQFVLIDYKGGGLALTFDNKENKIKLPHVVGTITNLDIVEIKRSLASINSELKRRQTMFKKAREHLNESSMDIYKYQKYYRLGKLNESLSHLFIISDEFAELKSQQPEFMAELISTARIGRSLGVHLILATQKPNGVVDDQIWSNSKFRVCLKVQDKSDSMDMLKCPDAAMLKETGRFYLQVGYNEFFAKGQSAYAGMPYYESDKKVVVVDSSIEFIDNIGITYKESDVEKNNTQYVYKGEELPNVLNYIIDTAKKEKIQVQPLWLPSIPKIIYVDELREKYNYKKEDYFLDVIIGEYDYPSKQKQGLLTIPMSQDGNALLYGSSGSGKENFITTMIYSIISNYSINEVNLYILDFGSEVLNNFEICPYIGDIIHNGEDEKINNMFKMIDEEINLRRKTFASFNGNYTDYVKGTKEDILPNIVIIINSFEVFIELYEDYSEKIAELTRDCAKFGIYFILSSSSTNGIKLKISQNFKNIYTLQQNDESDYKSLLGNTGDIVPSKIFGRGLVKLDKVVEFQTAYAKNKDTLYDDLKLYSIRVFTENDSKAKSIPILPEVVNIKDVITDNNISINNIPIGINKKDLNIVGLNLKRNSSYLITGKNIDDFLYFINVFLQIIDITDSYSTLIYDTKFIYDNVIFKNSSYLNNNFIKSMTDIKNYTEQIKKVLDDNSGNIRAINNVKEVIVVIVGVDKFLNSLDYEQKQLFETILKLNKNSMKIHFVLIDSSNSLKKYEYEDWYSNSVDASYGLWIGDGFADQLTLKPSKIINEYYDSIGNNMGYILDNGGVDLIKYVEKIDGK